MTWEETIKYVRTLPEYKGLIEVSYLDEDLIKNVERFKVSEEYNETKKLIQVFAPSGQSILDIGSGNGISAVCFSLDGFQVTASEPDKSSTVGSRAIKTLKDHFGLANLNIIEEFAEDLNIEKEFDIVYVRQAVHHAYDLNAFIKNLARRLKKGGLLLTVRDHVIYDAADKESFLNTHPLQKFYGGENAFTLEQYLAAFQRANVDVRRIIKHFDSVINYFPMSRDVVDNYSAHQEEIFKDSLKKKIGFLSKNRILFDLYKLKNNFKAKSELNEKSVEGRMYSFVAIKQ